MRIAVIPFPPDELEYYKRKYLDLVGEDKRRKSVTGRRATKGTSMLEQNTEPLTTVNLNLNLRSILSCPTRMLT